VSVCNSRLQGTWPRPAYLAPQCPPFRPQRPARLIHPLKRSFMHKLLVRSLSRPWMRSLQPPTSMRLTSKSLAALPLIHCLSVSSGDVTACLCHLEMSIHCLSVSSGDVVIHCLSVSSGDVVRRIITLDLSSCSAFAVPCCCVSQDMRARTARGILLPSKPQPPPPSCPAPPHLETFLLQFGQARGEQQ